MATPTKRTPTHRYRRPPAQVPDWATTRPVYRQRRPTATPLYPVVQHHLETFLTQAAEIDPMGNGVPFWVEKDFRAYLRCGILAHGFARAGHPPKVGSKDCGHERLIPFSCKGRGLCPSSNTRRMAGVAAHVTDNVLPHLPVRQWVLSLPDHASRGARLRAFLHHNPDIAGAVLRIFLRAIRTTLRGTSPGAPRDAKLGAISFLHRFGSSLNTHFHYHCVILDGAFSDGPGGDARFKDHRAVLSPILVFDPPAPSPVCRLASRLPQPSHPRGPPGQPMDFRVTPMRFLLPTGCPWDPM